MSGNLVIGTLDLSTVALISDASELLSVNPVGGDLIELDFVAGAQWEAGESAAYEFSVPIILKGADESARLANLRTLQALADGTELTLTRTFTAGSAVSESCTGVLSAVILAWGFDLRDRVGVQLLFTALTVWV